LRISTPEAGNVLEVDSPNPVPSSVKITDLSLVKDRVIQHE